MPDYGVKVKPGQGMVRVEMGCAHHNALLYIVPSEASWVCSQENLPGHSLAGFLKELVRLRDPRVTDLMRRWGISFRELPLESDTPASG